MAATTQTHRCPHCGKSFEGDLLAPETERAGYKCLHCRLFIPVTRAEQPHQAA